MRRSLGLVVALVILVSACGGSETVAPTTEPAAQSSDSAPSIASPTTTTASEPSQANDAPKLDGTNWNVTDYSQGSGTITNVWKTEVTITFAADGTVSGSAGCNDFQATWTVSGAYDEFESGIPDPNDGQELSLDSLSWTETVCDDGAIMEQEAEILGLVQRVGRWVLIRGNFHLRDAEGGFLFEAEPAHP
jgi:heat shock protein HslJ